MADDTSAQMLRLAQALPSQPHRASWIIDTAELTMEDDSRKLLAQITFVDEFGHVYKTWFTSHELRALGVNAIEHSKEMEHEMKSGLIVAGEMPDPDVMEAATKAAAEVLGIKPKEGG